MRTTGDSSAGAGQVRLVTRADDLGSFHSANRASLEAYRDGLVRNVSLLVVGHCFDEAAEMVKAEKGLCLGLHATITSEWDTVRWPPVLPAERVPALVDKHGNLVQRVATANDQGATVEQIVAEVEAQLAKARDAGLGIEYLDTHMAFAWLEGVDAVMAALCRQEGLIYANAVPGLRRMPRDEQADDPVEALACSMEHLEEGTYLLVAHPAYDDREMRAVSLVGHATGSIARERDLERRFFTAPRILSAAEARGVRPVRYTEL